MRSAEWDAPLEKKTVELRGVRVAYTDLGHGPPLLFVHGIPTSGYLWRNVARALVDDYRVVIPDLMGLGDTDAPLTHRFDMQAQSEKLIELADHLQLDTFTLVCHDQGGAAAQWLAVHNKKRVRRFILTNCVCYDNWPVPLVAAFARGLAVKRSAHIARRLGLGARWAKSRVGMRLGVYDKRALSDRAIDEYFKFEGAGADKYEQFRLFTVAGDCRYSVQAAARFHELTMPTFMLWATEDRWLSASWAKRLASDIPGTRRVELIGFAGHFFQEEKPAEAAGHIREFLRAHE